MQMLRSIQFVKRQDINLTAWNDCIGRATNGLIYAKFEYLDQMGCKWDALVSGNYDYVMPLVWRKKFGICYLFYPPFCASLGIFGKGPDAVVVKEFLDAIPAKFRYWDFPLNYGNNFTLQNYTLAERSNYVLPLLRDYAQIYAGYRQNLRRNIKKASNLGFRTDKGFPVTEIIELAKAYTPGSPLEPSAYYSFEKLFDRLSAKNEAHTYGIRDKKGILLASAVFLFDQRRAYYMLVGNHPDGKTNGASHALIDAFIKDYAGSDYLLDFEGSDIRNLAFFYAGFGAVKETYPVIRSNRLPFPFNWLKK